MNPRAYKVQKLKISGKWETPGGFRMAQKSLFGHHLLFFLLYLLKTSELLNHKDAQKHFKSVFEHPKKNSKTNPNLKLYKNAKK